MMTISGGFCGTIQERVDLTGEEMNEQMNGKEERHRRLREP